MLFPQFSLSFYFPLHCTVIPFAERVLVLVNKNMQISALSKIFLANCSQDQRPNPAEIFLMASRSCLFHVYLTLMHFLKCTFLLLLTISLLRRVVPPQWMGPVIQQTSKLLGFYSLPCWSVSLVCLACSLQWENLVGWSWKCSQTAAR